MSRKSTWAALIAIMTVGLALRAYRLDDRSIWYDEAFSYTLVHEFTWTEMFTALRQDVHPPLYFVLLRLWSGVLGVAPLALRGFSIVMGGVTLGAIYLFTRDLYRYSCSDPATEETERTARSAGVAATALLAVFSSHIWWSQDAKMYSLATALIAFSAWFLVLGVATGSRGAWVGFVLASLAMLYTHNYALFTFVAECEFLAVWALVRYGPRGALADTRVRTAAVAVTAVGLGFLPWVPTLLAQSRRVKSDYWITPPNAWTIPHNLDLLFFPGNDFNVPNSRALGLVMILGGLVVWMLVQRRPLYWLIAALILTPILCALLVSLGFASIITPRYFLFAVLFVPTAIALVCATLIPRFTWNITLVLAVSSLWIHFQFLDCLFLNERGTYGIVQQVRERRQPGQAVIVTNAGVFFSIKYYAQAELQPRLLVSGQEIPHYLGGPILRVEDTITAAELERLPDQDIWVIDSTGFSIVPSARTAVPETWAPVPASRTAYREVFSWQGKVSSERYRRRQTAESLVPSLSERVP